MPFSHLSWRAIAAPGPISRTLRFERGDAVSKEPSLGTTNPLGIGPGLYAVKPFGEQSPQAHHRSGKIQKNADDGLPRPELRANVRGAAPRAIVLASAPGLLSYRPPVANVSAAAEAIATPLIVPCDTGVPSASESSTLDFSL